MTVAAGGHSARTDADGLARLPFAPSVKDERARVHGHPQGDDTTSLSTFCAWGERTLTAVFQFTDRPIYRPGDLVHFKGVVRARAGFGYETPKPTPHLLFRDR